MSNDPPAATTTSVQNWYQVEAEGLYSLAILGGLAFPGALAGALLVGALWYGTGSPLAHRVVMAGSGVFAFAVMHGPDLSLDLATRPGLGEVGAGPGLLSTSADRSSRRGTPRAASPPHLSNRRRVSDAHRLGAEQ